MSETDIVHVPHKASGEARNAVIGGHVQMMFDAITTMAANVAAGQVQGARHHRHQALGTHPQRPDGGGSRRSRLRGDHLARRDGAGRHAAAGRRQAQCRDRQGDQPGRREGRLGEAGRGAAGDVAWPSSTSICVPTSRNGPRWCRSPASRRTDRQGAKAKWYRGAHARRARCTRMERLSARCFGQVLGRARFRLAGGGAVGHTVAGLMGRTAAYESGLAALA